MQMTDDRTIAAPPTKVWDALFDPEVLKACVPGCQELTGNSEDGYEAVVVQKVGPVKATFKGQVTMQDVVAGESCTLVGEGKGGAAGFAKGAAQIRLVPDDAGGTVLHYEVDAKVGGKLAQLGSRIVDGFAKRMAGEFFTRFKDQVEDPAEIASAPAEDSVTEHEPAEVEARAEKKSWFKRVFN